MHIRAWKLRLSDMDSDCIPGITQGFCEEEGEESEVFTLDAKYKGKLKNSVTTILYSCCSVTQFSWQPHGVWHTRLPCPSLSPGVCSYSCPWM